MWHSARSPGSDSRTFFGLHLYLATRCCKNHLSARGLAQCKSGPGITCLVSVTKYHFSVTIHLHLASFYEQNTFKKIAGKMLIEQIIEFELRGPRPPGRTRTFITG